MFREDFDRNRARQAGVDGSIHFAHPASTKLVGDLVGAEFCSCRK